MDPKENDDLKPEASSFSQVEIPVAVMAIAIGGCICLGLVYMVFLRKKLKERQQCLQTAAGHDQPSLSRSDILELFARGQVEVVETDLENR
ncbi:hypothetical protein BS50DRAFT_109806 [Corynespora cassiicola Philippines]|uniref:Uncharacterized protein n=1 Tax=Corynespora cassiicola Philippines TaxID=1448308 RepID=A0A2T2ND37_CORCC|nr:hypothetical protein BS50DRAFT_109806 [Corynespora cassiicola Philippines]